MKTLYLESEVRMPLLKLPLRCTVLQASKGVLIYSPLKFSEAQLQQIRSLGKVTDLIAPSVLHHMFMSDARAHFPEAKVWAAPGLPEKDPKVKWDKVLTQDTWPYQDEIELLKLDGVPAMTEVIFYLRELKTILVTDLCFNLVHTQGLGASIILRFMGTYKKFGVSRLVGRFMKDAAAFKKSMQSLLQWDFNRIVMAHGEIVESDGKAKLKSSLEKRGYI